MLNSIYDFVDREAEIPQVEPEEPQMASIGREEGRVYRCEYCLKGFKKTSHLKQHIRSHTGHLTFNFYTNYTMILDFRISLRNSNSTAHLARSFNLNI